VGADRLDRLELDGTTATVHDRPGTFTAPVWTSDGRSFVFAAGQGNRQQLLRQDSEDGTARAIVRFGGTIGFVVSPDGGSVAFQVRGDDGTVNELSVVDLDTGATERLTDELALAFFWSPQGDKLLYLLPDPTPELVWFRWNVWDGGSSFSLPRWVPSTEFGRDYLGFFEQYAQSMSLWAPDGAAFAYAGTSETGEQGVFVQEARSGTEPIRVSQGVFASWSPA
jgi:Tol biopolymer transport system component